MTIEEVLALAPEAEIIKLDPNAKYLVVVKNNAMSLDGMGTFAIKLGEVGIHATVVAVHHAIENPIRVFEINQ